MSTNRRLGYAALALGLAAPFAGNPHRAARATVDVEALAGVVARGEDHVEAVELAAWIRERKPGLRVLDVRSQAEFDAYAIPTASHLSLDALARTTFDPTETLVLYSEGGAHAAQAWVLLRALGVRQVYFLRGGLADWLGEVMHPVLAADATAQARVAFERAAELSRYFGGQPSLESPELSGLSAQSVAPSGAPAEGAATASRTTALLQRTRRRGC